MKRFVLFPYVLLSFFLLGWMNLSRNIVDPVRAAFVSAFTPAWQAAEEVRIYLSDRPIGRSDLQSDALGFAHLQLENQVLKREIERLRELVLYNAKSQSEPCQKKAVMAPVIYRDPNSWSSSLWIGIGEKENEKAGSRIVAQNSPVVIGDALVGVIEYVGKHESRVRLITDANLNPAVRVARNEFPRETLFLIDALCHQLHKEDTLVKTLQDLKEKLSAQKEEIYLAKGEVHGNGAPFWRLRKPLLKGTGFNYDYADDFGTSRELGTGRLFSGMGETVSLIAEGDHLITSGLDGIFPFGLSVAIVTKVFPLQEGSFSYEIEASPTAVSMNDLRFVFVLPPL